MVPMTALIYTNVHQQRYRPCDSNTNVDISAHGTFLIKKVDI